MEKVVTEQGKFQVTLGLTFDCETEEQLDLLIAETQALYRSGGRRKGPELIDVKVLWKLWQLTHQNPDKQQEVKGQ